MSRRDKLAWLFAIVLSVAAHGALFWNGAIVWSADAGRATSQPQVTRLSFRTVTAEKPVEPEPVVAAKPVPPPPPTPKPKPKPVPTPAAKPKPRPEPKPVAEVKPPIETVVVEAPQPLAAPSPATPRTDADQERIDRLRQSYLGELMAHIEAHKFYPRAARRRNVEGVVEVSFVLLEDGRIRELAIREGHRFLREAAEQAVREALPLPVPPGEMHCPMPVSYGMEFRLSRSGE